jgi:hypothetical protein
MTRPRRSPDQQAALVALWRQSGLSALAFAKRHGFSPQSLARWAALRSPAPAPSALTFVRLETAARAAALVVEVGSARVRVEPGFDPTLLRAVVSALTETPS